LAAMAPDTTNNNKSKKLNFLMSIDLIMNYELQTTKRSSANIMMK
jgi:hypothetical protein